METEIARLLKEFEDGRMTRRQLMQSLAIVAVAAPAAANAATQTPAMEKAPWKTVSIDHISYAVADYKRSAEFYSNLMGWEVRNDNGQNQASLNNHISFGIAPWDTEKVKAELERRGLKPRPDMVGDNFKSFHVLDPDGWDLQISNQTKND